MKTIITSPKGPPLRRVLCSFLFGAAAFCVVATNIQAATQAPPDTVWVTTGYTIARYYANGTAINAYFITEPSVITEPLIIGGRVIDPGRYAGYLGGILVSGPTLYVGTAEGVTLSPIYRQLYHPTPVDYVIATYNAATGNVINFPFFALPFYPIDKIVPWGMALSDPYPVGPYGGPYLYVATTQGQVGISRIATITGGGTTPSFIASGPKAPYALAVKGNVLYVTNNAQNSNGDFYISTYHADSGKIMNANFIHIATGGLYGLALQGNTLYVSVFSGGAPGVYTYNATTGQPIKVPFVRVNEPWGIAIGSPPLNGHHPTLYVASHQDAMIYEFDAATGAKLFDSIQVGAPTNITVEPSGQAKSTEAPPQTEAKKETPKPPPAAFLQPAAAALSN